MLADADAGNFCRMITGLSRFCNVCPCPLGAAPSCCALFSYVLSVCEAPLSSRDACPPVNERSLQSTALMCVPVRLGWDVPPVLLLSYANQSRSAAETPDGI